jgi:hypothetical protein
MRGRWLSIRVPEVSLAAQCEPTIFEFFTGYPVTDELVALCRAEALIVPDDTEATNVAKLSRAA